MVHAAPRRRKVVPTSIFLSLLAVACTEERIDPVQPVEEIVHVERTAGCHPLGYADIPPDTFTSPATCLFPFPSFFSERADAASPTGVRVSLAAEQLPVAGPALDPTPFNAADGFSPVTPVLIHFGFDIDTSSLAGIHSAERSLEQDAAVVLLDLDTGKHVLHFVEMDENRKDSFPDRYAFIVRPIEPMTMGHRHAVLVRALQRTDEKPVLPTVAFEALRDAVLTDNEDVEAARPHMEELFAAAEQWGIPRSELTLAFDFQVASEDWLLGPAMSMRDEGLAAIEAGELSYTIDEVQVDPNPDIAKIVLGTFEVPTFVDETDRIVWDDDHRPIRQSPNRSYPFTMLVPARSKTDGPLPLVVLGHGIFGNGRDFLTGGGDGAAIQVLAQQFGGIVIATDWIGLSTHDLPRIAGEVAPDLNNLNLITDQLQQALINAIAMTKLALGPLKDDPQAQAADNALVDTSQVYYWGASLGGIEGSSFVTLSPDIQRAVFGVPGSAWSTMLTRSIVFPPVKAFIEVDFPDPLDQTFLTTIAQAQFDHSDPANITTRMFNRPLEDVPQDRIVVLQESIGDSQVPNLTTDILARAMGVKLLAPAFYEPVGVEVVDGPTTESCVTQFRMEGWDDPFPPDTNEPAEEENGVHHDMNFLPAAHLQIATLFFQGQVTMPCSGTCDPD